MKNTELFNPIIHSQDWESGTEVVEKSTETKVCKQCKAEKSVDDFYMADHKNHRPECKTCSRNNKTK